jgi:hypothetical protein
MNKHDEIETFCLNEAATIESGAVDEQMLVFSCSKFAAIDETECISDVIAKAKNDRTLVVKG